MNSRLDQRADDRSNQSFRKKRLTVNASKPAVSEHHTSDHDHSGKNDAKPKWHWNVVWYPALAATICSYAPTAAHLITFGHAIIAGSLMLLGSIYVLMRRSRKADALPWWTLTPKKCCPKHFALIQVWPSWALVNVPNWSFRVSGAPSIERDEFGEWHLVSMDGDLICRTDNLKRGHILLTRSEQHNGEYCIEIRFPADPPITDIFTLSV